MWVSWAVGRPTVPSKPTPCASKTQRYPGSSTQAPKRQLNRRVAYTSTRWLAYLCNVGKQYGRVADGIYLHALINALYRPTFQIPTMFEVGAWAASCDPELPPRS